MSDVHLRGLRALVAVADTGSITEAAQAHLFVSQPAVSRTLQRLQRELGMRLLRPEGRRVVLTEAGRTFADGARDVLAAYDDAVVAARAAAAAASGTLRVGLSTPVGRGLLPTMTATLRQTHPALRLDLVQVPWDDASGGLADGSVDVAFVWLPLLDDGLDHEVLVTEDRWVALPAGHPLADRRRIAFAELADEAFVALPPSAGRLRSFWLAEDVRSTPVRVGMEAASAEAAFEAVANGLGVALVAAGQVALSARPDVVCRPVDGLGPASLAVAWRADDRRSSVAAFVAAALT